MKGLSFIALLMLWFNTAHTAGIPKVIYGKDERVDVVDSGDNLMKEMARSTAGMFSSESLIQQPNGTYQVVGKTLVDYGWCSSERFSNQITAPVCTGWLAGPDILVTAGHCIRRASDCQNFKWVFDFALKTNTDKTVDISKDSVYSCKTIIASSVDGFIIKKDYAVIKLDRIVSDRKPLEFRKTGKISNTAKLVLIGHPSGLPLKIAPGAIVRSNSAAHYFVTNTDSYGGNSGSPVIDSATGIVEGILVNGEKDSISTSAGCFVSYVCKDDSCRGESATRTTSLPRL